MTGKPVFAIMVILNGVRDLDLVTTGKGEILSASADPLRRTHCSE